MKAPQIVSHRYRLIVSVLQTSYFLQLYLSVCVLIPAASQTSQFSKKPEDYALWLTGRGPKVHFAVGCDYCGV